jgi:hypothetical protein
VPIFRLRRVLSVAAGGWAANSHASPVPFLSLLRSSVCSVISCEIHPEPCALLGRGGSRKDLASVSPTGRQRKTHVNGVHPPTCVCSQHRVACCTVHTRECAGTLSYPNAPRVFSHAHPAFHHAFTRLRAFLHTHAQRTLRRCPPKSRRLCRSFSLPWARECRDGARLATAEEGVEATADSVAGLEAA